MSFADAKSGNHVVKENPWNIKLTDDLYVVAYFRLATEKTHVVNIGTLNALSTPDPDGTLVGSLTKGKEVTVVTTKDDWSMIIYGEEFAWVQSNCLTPIEKNIVSVSPTGMPTYPQPRRGRR